MRRNFIRNFINEAVMCLDPVSSKFYLNQEEVKLKQEEETKERPLPFYIVKKAFQNYVVNEDVQNQKPDTVFSSLQLRDKISSSLTALSNGDLSILERLPSKKNDPILHKSLFDIVNIYKQFNNCNKIFDENKRTKALELVSKDLIRVGDIDKVIQVAMTIPSSPAGQDASKNIFQALIVGGNVDKAIEIVNSFESITDKYPTLRNILRILVSVNLDKAIEIATNVINVTPCFKIHMLDCISKNLLEIGNVKKSIEVANSLPDHMRDFALSRISETLVKFDNIDYAIEIANTIPDDSLKGSALWNISIAIRGNAGRAAQIAQTALVIINRVIEEALAVPNIHYRERFLTRICCDLIFADNIDKSIEVAKKITTSVTRFNALKSVVTFLLENNNNQNAIKIKEIINTETDADVKASLQLIKTFL